MGHNAVSTPKPGTHAPPSSAHPGPTQSAALHRRDQDYLGRQLQAMYEDLLQEPIPGRFFALIARLERQDREQNHGS